MKSSSDKSGMPSAAAFSSLDGPIFSPASTAVVFLEIEPEFLPPCISIMALYSSRECRVVYALSIPNVGATMSKKIAKAAGDIDTLAAMTDEQLIAIDDVGPAMAHQPL